MQKKLIAAAVAGLVAVPALAQSNVTISGRFAMGWESYKVTDVAPNKTGNESRVSDQSSRLIFNVVEDLGGGLKAFGQLDSRFSGDLGNQPQNGVQQSWVGGLGNGNTGMGLMHDKWGKFTIGRWDVHYSEIDAAIGGNRAGSLQTLAGNGIMSQVNGGNIANATRTPNLMMWDSPNWNGFTARLGYSTNWQGVNPNEGSGVHAAGAKNGSSGGAWTGALRYNNGPWTAGYSHWSANAEGDAGTFLNLGTTVAAANGTTTPGVGSMATTKVTCTAVGALFNCSTLARAQDQRSDRLWLGYTFAMGLKLGVAWDRSRITWTNTGWGASTSARRSAWFVPVSYEFGPHKIYASYARAGDLSGSAVAANTNYKAHQWNLGYDYAFSKRTSAGIYYTKLSNNTDGSYELFGVSGVSGGANGATATGNSDDVRQIYIGLAHNF